MDVAPFLEGHPALANGIPWVKKSAPGKAGIGQLLWTDSTFRAPSNHASTDARAAVDVRRRPSLSASSPNAPRPQAPLSPSSACNEKFTRHVPPDRGPRPRLNLVVDTDAFCCRLRSRLASTPLQRSTNSWRPALLRHHPMAWVGFKSSNGPESPSHPGRELSGTDAPPRIGPRHTPLHGRCFPLVSRTSPISNFDFCIGAPRPPPPPNSPRKTPLGHPSSC